MNELVDLEPKPTNVCFQTWPFPFLAREQQQNQLPWMHSVYLTNQIASVSCSALLCAHRVLQVLQECQGSR